MPRERYVESSVVSLFPQRLVSARLVLRSPCAEDGPRLHAALLDSIARLRPWFAWAAEADISAANSELSARLARQRFLSGQELQFYLFLHGERPLIGVCGLCEPDWCGPRFEICYWLRTGYEGHGYMTEAVRSVTRFALQKLGAQRIVAYCDPANVRGSGVVARAGYTLWGQRQRLTHGKTGSQWQMVDVLVCEAESQLEELVVGRF